MLLLAVVGSLHPLLTFPKLVVRTSVHVRHGPVVSLSEWNLIWADRFPVGPHTGICIKVEWPPRF